ncbi:CRISPR type II-A/NMEMI-associated protein Csn2 [Butyrivibrio hungatei DSM 14810]|uniref:CRISPR type II-A/NMEMI-associated protein Csn2 n=1 Tax=Butyrivibrio hungatei DSM 14810 TaxID=1121132 RepID=A0A1M7S3B9_9FIRM|nr:type II-A CRISPR-associated protein Csn2 [Butyrivibrio hungatei]SHN52988.1 CRISPR type II-A/NMEMI-associated protein Csn2 [Butyrivibrio hungatei DSM 14810]
MRFAYDPYSISINLEEDKSTIIQIENRNAFSAILADLYMLVNYGEGESAIYDEEKSIDIKKYAELIIEPFSIDLNSRKIKARLYQEIEDEIRENFYSDFLDVSGAIQMYIEKISENIQYSISFQDHISIEDLLKIENIQMDYPCDNICEKINIYMKLLKSACKIDTIFIADINRFVSEKELSEILVDARYNKINIVLINSSPIKDIPEQTNLFILDEELCFWKA